MRLETVWQTRLFVILARAAPVAAILRRGPRRGARHAIAPAREIADFRANTFSALQPSADAFRW